MRIGPRERNAPATLWIQAHRADREAMTDWQRETGFGSRGRLKYKLHVGSVQARRRLEECDALEHVAGQRPRSAHQVFEHIHEPAWQRTRRDAVGGWVGGTHHDRTGQMIMEIAADAR